MQTSDISKLLLYSKSVQDEQADEWLQLKVDTNKADNPSKLICKKKYNLYLFFSECGRLSVTEKPLLCNLRQKCHVNSKNERRMLTKLII